MGCLDCFCFTHTSDCKSSANYEPSSIESNLQQNDLEDWTAVDTFGKKVFTGINNSTGIYVFSSDRDVWFSAPSNKQYIKNIILMLICVFILFSNLKLNILVIN